MRVIGRDDLLSFVVPCGSEWPQHCRSCARSTAADEEAVTVTNQHALNQSVLSSIQVRTWNEHHRAIHAPGEV
jgi:hypothetical protein